MIIVIVIEMMMMMMILLDILVGINHGTSVSMPCPVALFQKEKSNGKKKGTRKGEG